MRQGIVFICMFTEIALARKTKLRKEKAYSRNEVMRLAGNTKYLYFIEVDLDLEFLMGIYKLVLADHVS